MRQTGISGQSTEQRSRNSWDYLENSGLKRSRHSPILCWLGLHSGGWAYSAKGSCDQSRVCTACGQTQMRTKHTWDRGWEGAGELRTCNRCGQVETRGTTRQDLCEGLRALGVEAAMALQGRPEEKSGDDSIGLVDISRSPIHWVNVRKWENEGTYYATDYGVPDSRSLPKIQIKSVRVRSFPVFGKVTDVRWDGDDKGIGVAECLTADSELKYAIIASAAEIKVSTAPEHKCWLIPHNSKDAPSAQLWRCYEMVADNLMATQIARGAK